MLHSRTRWIHQMVRSTWLSAGLCLIATSAAAQAFFPIDQGTSSGRFIEPPRAILQQLKLAETAIEQRRYGEAVATLGEMLERKTVVVDDELSGQDFFLLKQNDSGPTQVDVTLMGVARKLLSGLPSEAIAQYELIYGAQARKLLDEAGQSRRWPDVYEVKRRFFHTEAGRDATELLVHDAIYQGKMVEAKRLATTLSTHPKLDNKAKSIVKALILSLDGSVAGRATGGVNQGSAANANSANANSPVRTRRQGIATDFRVFSGQLANAENGGGQLPLPDPLYTVVTTGSEKQERALLESVDAMSSMGDLPPPSWLPLRIGNQLLMRTTERLVGVDFVTGKRVWQFPWFESNEKIEAASTELDGMPDEESGYSLLKQRVWNDLPYGRISSDGKRVFLLGDLAQMQVAMLSPLMGVQGTRPGETGTNSLIALDLETEGKLVWQLGGDLPGSEAIAGAFFLGAPLPIDDAIYVMAELSGDIVLLCLEAATGIERWRQQLLAIETGGIDTDPVRRVAGASAAYQDGVLVCATGAGAIVAVDIHDRMLLWGLATERNDTINQNVTGRRENFIPDQLLKRWWDPTPMIVGNTVYVTPIETDRLFALDLLTGIKRWKEFSRNQTVSRYLAGVHQGTLVLVGGDSVRGVDSTNGRATWKTRPGWLDSGEQISGLGMFGTIDNPATGQPEPTYFVPTSANRIIAVSLKEGSSLGHRKIAYPAGNLIAVDGQIISQSATLLSVAHGQVSLEPKVASALEADPNNVEMLNRRAQLLLEQGQRGEALKWLEKSRALDPENIEVQQLTINAMFGALKEDFVGNGEMLNVLDRLIDQPADRAELIKLQIRAAIDRKRPVEATNRLIDLSTLVLDPGLAAQVQLGESESSRTVSLDSWIGARANEAFSIADAKSRGEIEAAIAKHATKYQDASTAYVQRLVRQFGPMPGSNPLLRQLISTYNQERQWLAMERVVLAAASTTPDQLDKLSPWQAIALAAAYAGGGMKPDAAAALQAAMSDKAAAIKAAKELGIDLEQLTTQSAGGDFLQSWDGEVSVLLPEDPIAGRIAMSRRINVGETKRVIGRTFAGWQLVSDESSPVAVRDPLGIVHPIPVDGRNRPEDNHRQAVFSGGLMIALLPGELVAVNLFSLLDGQSDPVLWRRPWQTESSGQGFKPSSESTKFGDQIYRYLIRPAGSNTVQSELQLGPIFGDTFYLLQGNELLAINAVTREIQWRNFEAPNGGAIVCDGETVAIVSESSQLIVKYDCRDGKRIGEEPFVDYRLWASTDRSVLLYRELDEGRRELVLKNPINGEILLTHTFAGLSESVKLLGRIVEGTYVVTLSSAGQLLIWDLENARVVNDMKVDAMPQLSGLHVLPRLDSLVILPAIDNVAEDLGNVALAAAHGNEHVKVDGSIWAVDLKTGKTKWSCPLHNEPWGCTLTQSPVSPLVILSHSKSRYSTTGSRTKTVDVMAIDVRDGKPLISLDQLVESFNSNDIETRLTVQPPQQRVIVNIGPMVIDYAFGERINTIKP